MIKNTVLLKKEDGLMDVSFAILTYLLIYFAVTIHEFGHTWAMQKYSVFIQKIGIGMKIPFIPSSLKWIFVRGILKDVEVELKPIPLYAFVKPTRVGECQLKIRPANEKFVIYGSGIIANLVFFCLLFSFLCLFYEKEYFPSLFYLADTIALNALIYVVLAALIIIFKQWFCQYIIPLAGLVLFGWLVYEIALAPFEVVGGPVYLGKIILSIKTIDRAIFFGAVISLNLGLINSFPLFVLDGGRITDLWVGKFLPRYRIAFRIIGVVILLLLLVFAVLVDFIR